MSCGQKVLVTNYWYKLLKSDSNKIIDKQTFLHHFYGTAIPLMKVHLIFEAFTNIFYSCLASLVPVGALAAPSALTFFIRVSEVVGFRLF